MGLDKGEYKKRQFGALRVEGLAFCLRGLRPWGIRWV